jgi:hypothetical protein
MPMVYAVKELKRVEISKCLPGGDKPPAFYRIAELWFDSPEQMKAITSTAEWKKIADDCRISPRPAPRSWSRKSASSKHHLDFTASGQALACLIRPGDLERSAVESAGLGRCG